MSNNIDLEYSSNLSLMSISSYVEYETGNINTLVSVALEDPTDTDTHYYKRFLACLHWNYEDNHWNILIIKLESLSFYNFEKMFLHFSVREASF